MNLIFDVDDTLYEAKTAFDYALKTSLPQQKSLDYIVLYHKFREISDTCLSYLEQNIMTLEEMHIIRIRSCLWSCGIEMDSQKAREFQATYQSEQDKMALLPEMEAILKRYSQQDEFTLGIITNGPAAHQTLKIARLGLEKYVSPDAIFISGKYGLAKPQLEFFKLVQKKLKLVPEKTVYIGDSYQNDVIGAKTAGWQMIWVNRMKRELPENPFYQPDYTITRHGELAEVLKKLTTK